MNGKKMSSNGVNKRWIGGKERYSMWELVLKTGFVNWKLFSMMTRIKRKEAQQIITVCPTIN